MVLSLTRVLYTYAGGRTYIDSSLRQQCPLEFGFIAFAFDFFDDFSMADLDMAYIYSWGGQSIERLGLNWYLCLNGDQ